MFGERWGVIFAAVVTVFAVQPASFAATVTHCHVVDGKADRVCTPGALNPDVTQSTIHSTICVPGWAAQARPSVNYTDTLKQQQKIVYGENDVPDSQLEEDHLIPLSAGGSSTDPLNLWPEPRDGHNNAATKDVYELRLHKAICSGQIMLTQGQHNIVSEWTH